MVKKKIKKSSLEHHAPYIAIVAVVAVVAIVFLILNFTGGNVAGEAIRLSKTTTEVNVCNEGKKCGFMNEGEIVNAVLNVLNKCSPFQINPQYESEGYTCNDRCAKEYKRCIFGSRYQIDADKADLVDGMVACDSPINKKATAIFYHCYCC